jgi:transcriptional regulator with XRE-family HTH domain
MSPTTLLMPNRDTVPGLADKLKEARAATGLSQIEAGQKSGVHHVSIAKFETDKSTPTLRVLIKLAETYGVTVVDLLPESLTKKLPSKRPAKRPRQ